MARVHLQILLALEGWTDAEGILSVEERVNPRERPSHQSKLTIKYYQSFGTKPVMLYLFVDSPHWLYQYIYKNLLNIYIYTQSGFQCMLEWATTKRLCWRSKAQSGQPLLDPHPSFILVLDTGLSFQKTDKDEMKLKNTFKSSSCARLRTSNELFCWFREWIDPRQKHLFPAKRLHRTLNIFMAH